MTARFLLRCLLAVVCPLSLYSATAEPWVTAAATSATPASAAQADVLVLLDESIHEIDAQGVESETRRYVIRLLNNQGSTSARATVQYDSKVDKVRSLRAWLVRPGVKTELRSNADWADVCTEDSSTLASDKRQRTVSFRDKAVAGDIFAFESKVVGPMLEAALRRHFGSTDPVLVQRMTVTVPAGFTLTHKGWGPVEPVLTGAESGTTKTWTLTDLPHRPEESWSTRAATTDCDLVIRINPPPANPAFTAKSFQSWSEVSSWIEALNTGQCDSSPALAAKARELTASCPDSLSKIRALATYVQKLRYVANNEGLSKGLGYVARKSSLVFSRGFGDCKDKANLLRALLREVGIEAFPVGVSTRGGDFVRSEIPTEIYFNHAISAIRVDDAVQLPAVIQTERAGRFLIFDPTDSHTVIGDLPYYLQGSLAHIEIAELNAPVRLPDISAEQGFRFSRHATMKFNEGLLKITCTASANGQIASQLRARHAVIQSAKDFDAFALDILGDQLHAKAPASRSFLNKPEDNTFEISVETAAPDYIQHAPGGLLIAKLDVLGRIFIPVLPEKTRQLPIRFPALMQEDDITFVIPDSLTITELPRSTTVEHEYGSFKQTVSSADGVVSMHRTLILRSREIPAADFAKVKAFLSSLARAERSALLLKQK